MNSKVFFVIFLLIILGTTVHAELLDCNTNFCEGIKLLYPDDEAREIIAYEKVSFNEYSPSFEEINYYNEELYYNQPNIQTYSLRYITQAYLLDPLIGFSVQKDENHYHQQKVRSQANYGYKISPPTNIYPPKNQVIGKENTVTQEGYCKRTSRLTVNTDIEHYKNGQFIGKGQTAEYETSEKEVNHTTKLSLIAKLYQRLYVWEQDQCYKETCQQKDANGNCISYVCEKYYYICTFQAQRFIEYPPLILTSATETVAPPYEYIEPSITFSEGEPNTLEIWYNKTTLNSIQFKVNALYYQEDHNKFGLEFLETEHLQVKSEEDFRQTHTLRLLERTEQDKQVYLKFDLRNPTIEICTITTTDNAYNTYEYQCPEIKVIPQPTIHLKKDKNRYNPGDTVILEIGILQDNEWISGDLEIEYAGNTYKIQVGDSPKKIELPAIEGKIIASYNGTEEYTPSTRELTISHKKIPTSYWKLLLKYAILVYLFIRLILWIGKKWSGK